MHILAGACEHRSLRGCVFVKRFPKKLGRQDYLVLTIETIRQVLMVVAASSSVEATVIVDGLQKPLYRTVRVGASSPPAIRVRKVRGLPEESDEFLRLADAVAGCAGPPVKAWSTREVCMRQRSPPKLYLN